MKSADVLSAIRRKYPKTAVVREVVLSDTRQIAILNLWRLQTSPRYWRPKIEAQNLPLADGIPAGWSPETAKFDRRIDALMVDGVQRTAVEIKVTVPDFRRDTDEKRRAWRASTHRFVYATPTGLLTLDQIPDGCGLWEVAEDGVLTVVKRAAVNRGPDPLPEHLVNSMFFRVSNYERKAELG